MNINIKLPRIDPILVDNIEDFLKTSYGSKRPPTISAKLLALLIAMSRNHTPAPTREVLADAIGSSKFGVDSVISQSLSRGLIREAVETAPGRVARRESVVRRRYYKPTRRLLLEARAA